MGVQSRRDFLAAAGGVIAAGLFRPAFAGGGPAAPHHIGQIAGYGGRPFAPDRMTIQDVIGLIVAAIPGGLLAETVDTVKTGDPSRPVTGIATTFLATSDVIESAARRGVNLIITHEPTFYNHLDEVDWLAGDAVYEAKLRLLTQHEMVVWRFHDYWHRHEPDGITMGALKRLGWEEYASSGDVNLCDIPPTPLSDLVRHLKAGFGTDTVRVMGDPGMSCERVGLLLGAWGGRRQIQFISRPDVDVLVCGEVREWETTEYVRDAWSAGLRKGLVCVGHAPSEEPGMEWLVEWLRPRIPGVEVFHLPAGDPFRYV